MKKNLIKSFVLTLLFAPILVSCTGESSDFVADQSLGYCLSVTKAVDSRAQIANRLSFSAKYNYTTNVVDLTLTGLVLPTGGNGQGLPKISLPQLSWKYNDKGWKVTEAENVVSQITGMSDVPVFSKIKFMLLDAFIGESYQPGILYKLDMNYNDADYEIMGCCMTGKTVSKADETTYIPEEDAAIPNDKKPIYWVDLDFKSSKATIYIFNAKFLGAMPSLNMVFSDIDFSTNNGEVILDCNALIPTCEGTPFPRFPITKLKGTLDYTTGMNIEFHCDYNGTDYLVSFDGKY